MLSLINRALTIEKANGNAQILQNDLAKSYVLQPKMNFAQISPFIKNEIMAAESEVLYIGYKSEGGSDGEKDFIAALHALDKKSGLLKKKIIVRIIVDCIEGIASWFMSRPETKLKYQYFKHLDFQYADHRHFDLGSFHQKQLVIDNYKAILMSGEFSHANNYKFQNRGWTEIATCLQGVKAVQHVRNGFIAAWNSTQTHVLNGKKLAFYNKTPAKPTHTHPQTAKLAVLYLHKRANGYIFNRKFLSPHTIAVKTAIENATRQINIMMPNINEPTILEALTKAYLRGIKINIITGKYHNELAENLPLMGGSNIKALQTLLNKLQAKNVEDYSRLKIRFSSDDSGRIVKHHGRQTLHAKLIIIDDLIIAGSSVLDKQSTFHSQEGDVCILSDATVQDEYLCLFNSIFKKGLNAFNCPGRTLKTEWQHKVLEIEKLLHSVICMLNEKVKSDPKSKEIISDIIGSHEEPNTLAYTKSIINEMKVNPIKIHEKDVSSLANQLLRVAQTKCIDNQLVKSHLEQEKFFHRVFRTIKDGLLNILPGFYFKTKMSTENLVPLAGHRILQKLSFFQPKINRESEDELSDVQPKHTPVTTLRHT